jgi:hypothetical protein
MVGTHKAGCGCGLGATATGQTVDASKALALILRQYAALAAQGERLRQVLVAGGQVPCPVWDAYNQVCLDYLAKSQPVFDQLAQKGIVVDQVVYSAGQPVADPTVPGQYKTLRVTAPLRPPGFGAVTGACAGIATFQDAQAVEGWTPVPIEMGAVSAATLATIGSGFALMLLGPSGVVLGAIGYETFKAYQPINVWFEAFADAGIYTVSSYSDCFERSRQAGVQATQASATCASAKTNPIEQIKTKLLAGGWDWWTWAVIGGGIIAAGSLIAFWLHNRTEPVVVVAGLGCDTNHPPVQRRRKTRRKRQPLLLED